VTVPTPTPVATAVYRVAARVLAAVQEALNEVRSPVDRAGVYPASIPWDECECRTLAVAVTRQYVSTVFPLVDETAVGCHGGFVAADVVVQVLTCVPQPDGRSLAPEPSALDVTSQQVLLDAWVALSTVQCTLADLVDEDVIVEYVLRPQVFAGPEGACVGSALGFTVAVEQSTTLE
jgi:hypothetical protein